MKKIDPQHLCDMAHYRAEERGQAGQDAISIQIAYALANPGINHFGVLYRTDAPLCLHKAMADMVIAAALDLQKNHGWRLKLMDGLRTIDAQIAMEKSEHTDPAWYANSMLSAAGKGAHPKGGMAVDLMPIDAAGNEIDMGTAFDSLDPVRAARHYTGDGISDAAKHHRLIVERAMQRAALAQGKLLAPLRSEHWDYRFPENFQDGWRVLESLCRVADVPFDEALKTVEMTDYRSFCEHWAAVLGMLGPRDMPLEVRRKAGADVVEVMKDKTVGERLNQTGQMPEAMGVEAFAAAVKAQHERVAEIAKVLGMPRKR